MSSYNHIQEIITLLNRIKNFEKNHWIVESTTIVSRNLDNEGETIEKSKGAIPKKLNRDVENRHSEVTINFKF